MRILDFDTFLALPPGALFAICDGYVVRGLQLKGESIGNIDFYYVDLSTCFDWGSSDEFIGGLDRMRAGEGIWSNLDTVSRDGVYDRSRVFLVWEPEDIQSLVRVLVGHLQNPT